MCTVYIYVIWEVATNTIHWVGSIEESALYAIAKINPLISAFKKEKQRVIAKYPEVQTSIVRPMLPMHSAYHYSSLVRDVRSITGTRLIRCCYLMKTCALIPLCTYWFQTPLVSYFLSQPFTPTYFLTNYIAGLKETFYMSK